MDQAAKQLDTDRVLVPHRYMILLSGHDSSRISPSMLLAIKTEVAMHAAKQGYRLAGELQLRLEIDTKIPRGSIKVGSSAVDKDVSWQPALLLSGERIEIQRGTTTLGRDERADITVDDRGLSRIHFEIAWNGETAAIRDNSSTNGTFVDGVRISEVVLRNGSKITAGRSEIGFELIAQEVRQ